MPLGYCCHHAIVHSTTKLKVESTSATTHHELCHPLLNGLKVESTSNQTGAASYAAVYARVTRPYSGWCPKPSGYRFQVEEGGAWSLLVAAGTFGTDGSASTAVTDNTLDNYHTTQQKHTTSSGSGGGSVGGMDAWIGTDAAARSSPPAYTTLASGSSQCGSEWCTINLAVNSNWITASINGTVLLVASIVKPRND
jgi:hypothetical protein